jgi:hypothetical protein
MGWDTMGLHGKTALGRVYLILRQNRVETCPVSVTTPDQTRRLNGRDSALLRHHNPDSGLTEEYNLDFLSPIERRRA